MKTLWLFFFLLFLAGMAGAQDIIHKKNGEEIRVRIIDVNPGVIKYKKFESQDGPVYSIARDQVERISYENGKSESFEEEDPPREIEKEKVTLPDGKPSSTFGWHLGFGTSTIHGDLIQSKWRVASTIGASFTLPVGTQSTFLFAIDIISVGCGLEDDAFTNLSDSSYYQITNWLQDMGYIGFQAMFRQYLNPGRNYFMGLGLYGSFLMNAMWQGDAAITYTNGNTANISFQDDLIEYYKTFDYGLTMGAGGRIPLGESKKWHITLEARFSYGLQNIFDYQSNGFIESHESNLYGLLLMGVDIPTKSSQ